MNIKKFMGKFVSATEETVKELIRVSNDLSHTKSHINDNAKTINENFLRVFARLTEIELAITSHKEKP